MPQEVEKNVAQTMSFYASAFRDIAVHYLLDIIQNEYREGGYGTEQITGGAIYCYKSELTAEKKRKAIEWTICVKKI
jgi:hypothetical protein